MPSKKKPAPADQLVRAGDGQAFIAQDELQAVVDLDRVIDGLFINLRRRLRMGADVEPGKLTVEDEQPDSDLDAIDTRPIATLSNHGICINIRGQRLKRERASHAK